MIVTSLRDRNAPLIVFKAEFSSQLPRLKVIVTLRVERDDRDVFVFFLFLKRYLALAGRFSSSFEMGNYGISSA